MQKGLQWLDDTDFDLRSSFSLLLAVFPFLCRVVLSFIRALCSFGSISACLCVSVSLPILPYLVCASCLSLVSLWLCPCVSSPFSCTNARSCLLAVVFYLGIVQMVYWILTPLHSLFPLPSLSLTHSPLLIRNPVVGAPEHDRLASHASVRRLSQRLGQQGMPRHWQACTTQPMLSFHSLSSKRLFLHDLWLRVLSLAAPE